MPKRVAFLCVVLIVLSTSTFAQNITDPTKIFRGVVPQGMRQSAQRQDAASSSESLLQWEKQVVDILSRNKRYPADSMSMGEEGTAVVAFTLDRSGHLINSRIDQSSGSTLLDNEVIDLLNRTQPFPSLPSDYVGTQIKLSLPIRFSLKDKPLLQPTAKHLDTPNASGENEAQNAPPQLPVDQSNEAPVGDCDNYAASNFDPLRKATGVPTDQVNPASAIPACEDAVRQYPNSARLIFQLGRAYQKANNFTAALPQFTKAAEQNYVSAWTALGSCSSCPSTMRVRYERNSKQSHGTWSSWTRLLTTHAHWRRSSGAQGIPSPIGVLPNPPRRSLKDG